MAYARVHTFTYSVREGPDSSSASRRLALRDTQRAGSSQGAAEGDIM